MIDIEYIKKRFCEEFPEASKAINENVREHKTQALAMYSAFRIGFVKGYEVSGGNMVAGR